MAIKIYRIPSWDLAFECEPEELTMVLMDYARNDCHHARNLCLSGFDLSDIDLEGLDLSGTNFYRANLSNANLKSTRLSGTCFSHATLDGTDLCHARGIGEADFLGATMHHVRVYDQESKKTRTLVCDPMHISGLGLPVLVLDDMLAVGCYFMHITNWQEFIKEKKNDSSPWQNLWEELRKAFPLTDKFAEYYSNILLEQIPILRDGYSGHTMLRSDADVPANDETLTVIIKNDYKGPDGKSGEGLTVADVTCNAGMASNMHVSDIINLGETKTYSAKSNARMFFKLKGLSTGIIYQGGATSPHCSDNSATGYGVCGLDTYNATGNGSFTFHPGRHDYADWSHSDSYDGDSPDYGKDCDPG
ncbi:MAG: pentapeptide repeat-containing protein [Candidatus Thiodiazotropha endolucinida]|nr:pentapeptide repeat-containing protein [Candidatus Thiodiazotropha endolucinida]